MWQFINSLTNGAKGGAVSFPIIIGIVLAIAFIAMLLVTVFTLISLKKAELKAKRIINIPPSAMKGGDDKKGTEDDVNSTTSWPIGERLNKYLIAKGYIRADGVVKSFFKALDFLKNSLGVGYKYKLPWYMIVGSEEAGKSSLLGGFTSDEIYDDEGEDPLCKWWFLKSGVVLDIKGSVFLPKKGFNADDKNWNIILNMLSRYRAERPLNGIILTIPADELYGKNKLSAEDLTKKAQYVARKLNFAQNYLGMKLPLYIAITKTDVIPGFQSFCSEIPVRNRDNMLGWSSPYSIDVAYRSRLLDEGFQKLEDELNEIRMEIFSESFTTTTRDGVFVFPSELLTVKDSLGIYIDAIFKSSSVEERFYFRGFYFTGDSKMTPLLTFSGDAPDNDAMAIIGTPDADVNEVGSVSASFGGEQFTPKKIFFFEDLLLKKIFAEEGLASPMKSKIYRSNKSIFIAKVSTAAFVVIGSYGLFKADDQLKINRNALYPSLFKISSLIKSAGDLTYKNLEKDGNEILADCTNHLLSMMRQLNNVRFSSLFVPASWFSSINSDLTETLRTSYQRVIVRTIYMNLTLKAKELLNAKSERGSDSIAQVLNPSNSVEYEQLKSYVFGLIELEQNIKKFDSLRSSGDPKDLNDLIDYTFHGALSQEFLDNYQEFRNILINTPFPPINLAPYKQVAYNTLITLFQSYLDAVFTTRSENSIVSILAKFVERLTRQKLKEIPNCSRIVKFSKDLTAVCKELGDEGKTWLDKDAFEPDDEYDAFLDGVETLFGKETAQKLLDATAINFGYLKSKLLGFNDMLKSDIPNREVKTIAKEKESVSSGIYKMERCLAALCSEPFMETPGNYQLITDIPEGKMIFWDDELVQYAYNTGKSFEQFTASKIKEFPRAMQEGIALLAKSNLRAVIAGIIAKSQSLVDSPVGISSEITSEEILQKQTAELKGVAPRLTNLLNILRDDKFGFVFGDLRSVLNKIGFSLLNHIDKLLENQKPYVPSDLTFNFWNGEAGAGLAAFSAADMEELILYLQLQRSVILRLAIDFAAPIVEFLNEDAVFDKNYGNHAQLTKWTRIVQSVKEMQKKSPTSSATALERFIKRTLNEYTLDNVTSKIETNDLKGESGDYFLNIIKEIKRGVMARAEVLIRKRNIARYNSLRDYYTKHLEGKYPFSNYDKSQRTAVDADIEAVVEFFKTYDEFGGTPEKILDQIYQLGEDAKTVYEFLKKIHDLRQFLGDISNQETIKVNLEVNFSINKREETNTDYLVDRIFKPNNDSVIEPITADKSGIWYWGEPIEFDLRWATGDAQADKPVYDQNDPDLILDENTAKIQCVGNWSVLRLLQKYKAESFNASGLAPNQAALCFKVPLSSGKVSKIFVGITPSIPKKPGEPSITTLKVPTTVNKMPPMPASVISVANEAVLVSRIRANIDTEEISLVEEEDNKADEERQPKESKPNKKKTNRNPTDLKTKEAVLDVLKSDKTPEIKESVVEVSEEPIE
ncbi:MAG: hypothetical protein LBM19_04250 [Holosporales bacterium]|nr:hypothetical protein [Holosporales bacterium]